MFSTHSVGCKQARMVPRVTMVPLDIWVAMPVMNGMTNFLSMMKVLCNCDCRVMLYSAVNGYHFFCSFHWKYYVNFPCSHGDENH